MKRNVSLAEISDGRLYKANDMVKADCGGCNGCSRCCHGMGNSIILDPYDVYRMTTGMGKSMQELLAASVELNVVDGVILPNLKMQGTEEACAYLDSITFGRLKCGAPVDNAVKLAACALADVAARYQAAKADEPFRENDLVVKTTYVDEGVTLKRFRARAQGRAARINKRTSHITVLVANKEGDR